MVTDTLPCVSGYHWPAVRDFLARRTLNAFETVTQNSYARLLDKDTSLVATYDALENAFYIKANFNVSSFERENLTRVLGCQTPWLQARSSLMAAGIAPEQLSSSLSIAGCWSPFEALLRAIVGQQVSVKAAINQINLLVSLVAQKQALPLTSFPTPEQCAETDFSNLGMPQRRKQTITDACQAVVAMGGLYEPEQLDELIAIKGIGEWTLNYVRLRGFALPDIYLANDLIVKKMLTKYGIDAAKAIPWRSYLCLQAWEWSNHE